MIDQKCFTREWLDSFKNQKEHKRIQTNILEKMIRALHLVELLKDHGLDFVFKGGTSLILLLDNANRFSIDVDIICNEEKATLESVLNEVINKSDFISLVRDNRSNKKGVPKAHYKFEFQSVYNSNSTDHILLDILRDDTVYTDIIECPVETKWIVNNSDITVKTPSIDAITGDKLTAFAPNTIGIPYKKGGYSSSMEISKQLYDLSRLFDHISDMIVVKDNFLSIAEQEIKFRTRKDSQPVNDLTSESVLKDTINTCLLVTKRNANKREPDKSNFKLLQNGIKAFGDGYLMSGKFRIDDAVVTAAKVGYLATKILVQDLSPISYFEGQNIGSLLIEQPDWNYLNKLKKQPDKSAFYYWVKAVELLNKYKITF